MQVHIKYFMDPMWISLIPRSYFVNRPRNETTMWMPHTYKAGTCWCPSIVSVVHTSGQSCTTHRQPKIAEHPFFSLLSDVHMRSYILSVMWSFSDVQISSMVVRCRGIRNRSSCSDHGCPTFLSKKNADTLVLSSTKGWVWLFWSYSHTCKM